MKLFKLPDLGEGLTEVEIIEWLVDVGEEVELDQPVASVETAKAIVEIPSPEKGKIFKLYGEVAEMVQVGDPLLEFEDETTLSENPAPLKMDTGTVAGEIEVNNDVVNDSPTTVGQHANGVRATPAVRALARRLEVDLTIVTPSGNNDTITSTDVQRVAKIFKEIGAMKPLRGVRRAMAKNMSLASAEVVPVTIYDDVDIDLWKGKNDITMRLIRAIGKACQAEPALNAWYDSHAIGIRLLKKVDLAIAVDTKDGLFVPVLRDIANRDITDLRKGLNALKKATLARNIPPEEMRGYSFTLSNFGTFSGRYANPVVVPPTVGILAAGKIRQEVIPHKGEAVIRWVLPLSLTFDHRAATGGEATRFLGVLMNDLTLKT